MNWSPIIAFVAATLLVIAQAVYVRDVWQMKIKPNILSWIGWACLMGTSFWAQIIEEGWNWNMTGLGLSALGCMVIACSSILKKHFVLLPSDWLFLLAGVVCVGLYLISEDPWLTTIYAIFADLVLGWPTLRKAFINPHLEKTIGWPIGLASWSLTLFLCLDASPLQVLFPVYLFCWSAAMVWLTSRRINL